MKVTYISVWDSVLDLAKQVQRRINDSSLVVIKGLVMDRHQYGDFMTLFGNPSMKQSGDGTPILEMGKERFEVTQNWYDSKEGFILHFDGICNIPEHKHMPLSFLYGKQIEDLEGGRTVFYDLDDMFRSAMQNSILKSIRWSNVEGDYVRKLGLKPTRIRTFRHSPYSGKPYLLLDEWFTRQLYPIVGNLEHVDTTILQHYRDGFVQVQPYMHEWDPNDLLVWSNESLVHGRTQVTGGTRVMWRGIVWDNLRNRQRLQ